MKWSQVLVYRSHAGRSVPSCSTRTLAIQAQRAKFIETYVEQGSVSDACRVLCLARSTLYNWRDQDPEFAQALLNAKDAAIERLEGEAHRRALKKSDRLLMFLFAGAQARVVRQALRSPSAGLPDERSRWRQALGDRRDAAFG